MALRDALRRGDVPARLSDHMLGALLPETARGAAAAAIRLGNLLSEVTDHPISSGYARFPADGTSVAELLRIATERSKLGEREEERAGSPHVTASLPFTPLPRAAAFRGEKSGARVRPGLRQIPSRCRWSRPREPVPLPLPWYL